MGKWSGIAPSDGTTHWPDIAYPSYIVTGEYDYYELVLQQADYAMGWGPGCVFSTLSYVRQGSAGYANYSQERGNNWAMRNLGWGAFVAVDGSPEKAYLEDKLYNNLAVLEGIHDIPLDVPTTGGVAGSRQTAWNFGNTSECATNQGRHDCTAGQSPLQFWYDIGAYTQNAPICGFHGTTGCTNIQNPPTSGTADSNFQAGYSVYVRGLLYELGYSSIAPLQFMMKNYIHRMLGPAANVYAIGDYVFPIQGPTGAWATDYANQRTFIYPPDAATSAAGYTGSNCSTGTTGSPDGVDEPYALMTPAALSFGASYGMSDGTYTASAAYAAARSLMISCINTTPTPPNYSFITGSPKWDLVPRVLTANMSSSSPGQAAQPTFIPGAGTYSGSQTVTISTTLGTILCWNTTGAPQTNGAGTSCTTGTLINASSGTVPVSSSETLYAVAGAAGYTDSSVGSAAYVITGSTTSVIGGSGTISGKGTIKP